MADNYVIREKYTHVDIVDGQVMPVRGVVEADELVATQPDNEEAHNNGDYVQMEVFRQYAEHYRKIVTEINERKNQNKDNAVEQNNPQNQAPEPSAEKTADT